MIFCADLQSVSGYYHYLCLYVCYVKREAKVIAEAPKMSDRFFSYLVNKLVTEVFQFWV